MQLRYSLDLFGISNCDLIPDDDVIFRIDQPYLASFLAIAKLLVDEANIRHKKVFGNGKKALSQAELKEYVRKLRAIRPKKTT